MASRVNDIYILENFVSIVIAESDLNFELGCFKILNVAFKHKSAAVKQSKLIAGVLKLSERVGCDNCACATVNNILANKLFDIVSHNGVKAVKGFVKENIVGLGCKSEDGNRLSSHTFGECVQALVCGKIQILGKRFEAIIIKSGINGAIHSCHSLHCCAGKIEKLIGNVCYSLFHIRIFVNRRAVHFSRTFVCFVNA